MTDLSLRLLRLFGGQGFSLFLVLLPCHVDVQEQDDIGHDRSRNTREC